MTAQGRMERATRSLLRQLGVRVEDDPAAAGLVSLAVAVDEATTQSGTAAAHREFRLARAELDEWVARSRPAQPGPAGGIPGEDVHGDVTPGVTSLVDRLRRPS